MRKVLDYAAIAFSMLLAASMEFAPLSAAYANVQADNQVDVVEDDISSEVFAFDANNLQTNSDGSDDPLGNEVGENEGEVSVDQTDGASDEQEEPTKEEQPVSSDAPTTSQSQERPSSDEKVTDKDPIKQNGEQQQSAPFSYSEIVLPQGAHAAVVEVDENAGEVDWGAVQKAGVSYVLLALGHTDADANCVLDAQWARNVAECERLGIKFGVVFSTSAFGSSELEKEAQFVIENMQGVTPDLPIFLKLANSAAAGNDISGNVSTFCRAINDAGFSSGIYADSALWTNALSGDDLTAWDRWSAPQNADETEYPAGFSFCGSPQLIQVAGIDGQVHFGFLFGTVQQDVKKQPNQQQNQQQNTEQNKDGQLEAGASSIENGESPKDSKDAVELKAETESSAKDAQDKAAKEKAAKEARAKAIANQHIEYAPHVRNLGWRAVSSDGKTAGTTGKALSLEALKITLKNPVAAGSVVARAHVSDIGWQASVKDGAVVGTTGKAKAIEAIQLSLTGDMAKQFDIYYRVHASNIGWMAWAKNGQNAGSQGYGYAIEAIQIRLVEKGSAAPSASGSVTKQAFRRQGLAISYRGHVQNIGWQGAVKNGKTAGTTGRGLHLEALSVSLANQVPGEFGQVQVNAHVTNLGWRGYKTGTAGTTGRNLSIEAVQMKLTGEISKRYDIYYRVHAANIGWMAWAKNGQSAGTEGYAYSVEAVQVVLVPTGKGAPSASGSVTKDAFRKKPLGIQYRAHVTNIGWQGAVENGAIAGTTGRALTVQALSVSLVRQGTGEGGSVRVNPYLTGKGWTGFASGTVGTTGQNRAMQAIRAELTGEIANKYDLYYRTHVSGYGWLGWAKNGKESGTTGLGASVEAVQFKLVKKGGKAPGSTSNTFVSAPSYSYRSVVSGSWQSAVSGGAVSGTVGKNKPITNFKMSASSSSVSGGVQYRVHAANVGWKSRVSSGAQAGDSKNAIQAVQISLTGNLAK